MKKLMAYAVALTMLFAVGTANAQKASKKKTKAKTEKTVEKKTAAAGHMTKSGKADKRFKENKEMAAKGTKAAKTEARNAVKTKKEAVASAVSTKAEKAKTETAKAKSAASAKVADQVDNSAKGPHGETVYSGPRGGKYFINKNGKKEYLSSLKKH